MQVLSGTTARTKQTAVLVCPLGVVSVAKRQDDGITTRHPRNPFLLLLLPPLIPLTDTARKPCGGGEKKNAKVRFGVSRKYPI